MPKYQYDLDVTIEADTEDEADAIVNGMSTIKGIAAWETVDGPNEVDETIEDDDDEVK